MLNRHRLQLLFQNLRHRRQLDLPGEGVLLAKGVAGVGLAVRAADVAADVRAPGLDAQACNVSSNKTE